MPKFTPILRRLANVFIELSSWFGGRAPLIDRELIPGLVRVRHNRD